MSLKPSQEYLNVKTKSRMTDALEIEQPIKSYILEELVPGEDPAQLTHATPLITSGVLDSLATLKLVGFIEEKFSVLIEAHEVDAENFDTIERLAQFIISKNSA
jgi:acyl carrier protein